MLNSLMPLDEQCVNDTIRNALQKMKENALIEDYKVFTNDGRRNLDCLSIKLYWMKYIYMKTMSLTL